jgi:Receptor family ligand binding region
LRKPKFPSLQPETGLRWPCGAMKKIESLRLLIVLLLPLLTCISGAGIVHIGAILSASDSISGTVNPMYSQLITASLMAIHDLNSLYNKDRKISFKLSVRDSMSTYEGAIAATIDVSTRSSGVNEIHAIIGGGNNIVTDGMSSLLKYSDIYQIYSLSNISSLTSDYPNVFRVYPSSADESSTLAQLLRNYFSYSRVVLMHSSDIYGLASANKFIESATYLELDILHDCPIDDQAEIDECLQNLKDKDARVFVILISNIEVAGLLLTDGVTAGIFNDNCIFFGTGSLSTPLLWTQVSLDTAVVSKLASSFWTISLADADWKVTSRGRSFINKFRSQANTVATLSDGTRVCSNQTDDDGQFNLFQIVPKGKSQYLCAGENYSAFASDGSDIVSYTSYIYDAVWSAGVAVVLFADTYNNGVISTNTKAVSGRNSIFEKLNFVGYSGNISFAAGKDHQRSFGNAGLRYQISHFSGSESGTLSNITLHRVGTSTVDGVFTACTSDPTMQSAVTGGCSELRYGNIYNIRPSDRAPNIIQALSSAMRSTLYVMATIDFTVIVFITVILIVYRRSRILRAAQPAMMWIILSSNIFHVVRIVMSSGISNSFVCVCNVWTSHLGETTFSQFAVCYLTFLSSYHSYEKLLLV